MLCLWLPFSCGVCIVIADTDTNPRFWGFGFFHPFPRSHIWLYWCSVKFFPQIRNVCGNTFWGVIFTICQEIKQKTPCVSKAFSSPILPNNDRRAVIIILSGKGYFCNLSSSSVMNPLLFTSMYSLPSASNQRTPSDVVCLYTIRSPSFAVPFVMYGLVLLVCQFGALHPGQV